MSTISTRTVASPEAFYGAVTVTAAMFGDLIEMPQRR